MKRFCALLMTLALALGMLTACGSEAPVEGEEPAKDETAEEHFAGFDENAVSYPITINVWICNSGDTQQYLMDSAADFNASQDKYVVNITYAGSYTDALLKLQTSTAGDRPDIFASDTEGAYTVYADSELYVPLQFFVERDGYDMSDILSNLSTCYSDKDGNWQAMPLGNTATGFFYNDELLQKNNIDPRTLDSYDDIVEACYTLKSNGVATPFYMHTSSGFYSFPMTAQGVQYVDNNNGKDGTPTKSLISDTTSEAYAATVSFFKDLKELNENGLMIPFGTTVADGRAAFVDGSCAIYCGFISSFNTVNNAVGGKFTVGFHEAPTIDADAASHGQCVGGGCLFIGRRGEVANELGAWEFMKFMMSTERTVGFAKVSGYLPTTQSGSDSAEYQQYLSDVFPSAKYVIEAQANTEESCYNAWLPMFSDFHALCKEYYGKACENASATAEQLTEEFGAAVDECIEYYMLEHPDAANAG